MMHSHAQIFSNFCAALRTFLRSPPGIDNTKKLAPLPTDILDNGAELPKSSVQHMFAKHPFGTSAIVQIFHEDHITCITKGVCLFVVKLTTSVVDGLVKSGNFQPSFLVVLRASLFSTQSALQQFQLAIAAV
jgi:hypothetical protein